MPDRQTHRQTYMPTDRQAGRQAGRQTYIKHIYIYIQKNKDLDGLGVYTPQVASCWSSQSSQPADLAGHIQPQIGQPPLSPKGAPGPADNVVWMLQARSAG